MFKKFVSRSSETEIQKFFVTEILKFWQQISKTLSVIVGIGI